MSFKDFLKRGTGLDLVAGDESGDDKPSGVGSRQNTKQRRSGSNFDGGGGKLDDKILRQLEVEVSRAIEKLEDLRDKLRVRRGF
ncbi:hypothetical protein J4443_02875 [Candidatus Woesearchaeota archaeon]|nr:hypothetical protein [Candidatus Woesearchaeota archaeon]